MFHLGLSAEQVWTPAIVFAFPLWKNGSKFQQLQILDLGAHKPVYQE